MINEARYHGFVAELEKIARKRSGRRKKKKDSPLLLKLHSRIMNDAPSMYTQALKIILKMATRKGLL